jgi:hypothetical protein
MTNGEFNVIVSNIIKRVHLVLFKKSKEYSGKEDRLENFKRAAALQDISPTQALLGMIAKHFVSIAMLVEKASELGEVTNLLLWEEKITDIINYCILLEALVKEN